MKNSFKIIALIFTVLVAIGHDCALGSDPCNCKPQRGKKPYRLQAKTETKYDSFAESKVVLTPSTMRAWEKK